MTIEICKIALGTALMIIGIAVILYAIFFWPKK